MYWWLVLFVSIDAAMGLPLGDIIVKEVYGRRVAEREEEKLIASVAATVVVCAREHRSYRKPARGARVSES